MNSLSAFAASSSSSSFDWPLSSSLLSKYISWVGLHRHLKAKTIQAYLSSLKFIHIVRGADASAFSDPQIRLLIKGLENLEIYSPGASSQRKVMSLSILKLSGHALASADLPPADKTASWALFCLAFYGSLRIGELLCSRATVLDAVDSFLWSDVNRVSSDHVILSFRNTKTAKHEQVDLFTIPGCSSCPVSALKAYQQLAMRQVNSPVFSWVSGLFITIRDVNRPLSSLLQPLLVLVENVNRWRDMEPFLSTRDLRGTWSDFFSKKGLFLQKKSFS